MKVWHFFDRKSYKFVKFRLLNEPNYLSLNSCSIVWSLLKIGLLHEKIKYEHYFEARLDFKPSLKKLLLDSFSVVCIKNLSCFDIKSSHKEVKFEHIWSSLSNQNKFNLLLPSTSNIFGELLFHFLSIFVIVNCEPIFMNSLTSLKQ